MLRAYREHPNDFYLLRIGYAGTTGAITDIDQEGFLSPAFHAFPDMLRHDPVSGDNGPNFFGHALNTAAYLVNHPEFGWVAFGGNVARQGDIERLTPLDSARTRVYLAPVGLWLTLDAGTFEAVELNPRTHQVRVQLTAADPYTPAARLRVEQPATVQGVAKFAPTQHFNEERGAFVVPLSDIPTRITFQPK